MKEQILEILTSLDIILLIGELSETFAVTVPAGSIIPENFNSAEAIRRLVERLLEEQA